MIDLVTLLYLITGLNAVVIFNQQGELVHTITDSVKEPNGVTLDSNGRIILVCEEPQSPNILVSTSNSNSY